MEGCLWDQPRLLGRVTLLTVHHFVSFCEHLPCWLGAAHPPSGFLWTRTRGPRLGAGLGRPQGRAPCRLLSTCWGSSWRLQAPSHPLRVSVVIASPAGGGPQEGLGPGNRLRDGEGRRTLTWGSWAAVGSPRCAGMGLLRSCSPPSCLWAPACPAGQHAPQHTHTRGCA